MTFVTTIQVSKDTLKQLKILKAKLDFISYDDLIEYMINYSPLNYIDK